MKYKLKTPLVILQKYFSTYYHYPSVCSPDRNTNYNLKKRIQIRYKNIILTHINKSKKNTTPHTINKNRTLFYVSIHPKRKTTKKS